MQVDIEKIKKLPPDIRKDFMKMYVKYGEKKRESLVKRDFLSFVKYIWPDFIQGSHHKIIAKKFNNLLVLGWVDKVFRFTPESNREFPGVGRLNNF